MKKIIICLILIFHSIIFGESLRVKEGVIPNEVIINAFKTTDIPKGIKLFPMGMGNESKWEKEIKTKEEYIATINYLSLFLAYHPDFRRYMYSANERVDIAKKFFNTNEEEVYKGITEIEKENSKLEYIIDFSTERKGGFGIKYTEAPNYKIFIPFRIAENNEVIFLYESVSVYIPDISKIWLINFLDFSIEYQEYLKIKEELYKKSYNDW
ncbi:MULTISPECIES: hypothetical protein [Fusobacterium]|uniref:hypothetical protein n=1 Tax=Fusobacterium TaxID=848 RepID=UPI001476E964|nr:MULTISPECIES: hypothetical protein [Fusobacterium]NME35584.1 hypothetical protein [Fusobacterium sp. FSA-380-WT-3A]